MAGTNTLIRALPYSAVLAAVFSVLPYSMYGSLDVLNIPAVWNILNWGIIFAYFLFFLKYNSYFLLSQWWPIHLYLIWNLLSLVRAPFNAINYWDYRALITNGSGLLLPLVSYSCISLNFSKAILRRYVTYGIPMFFALAILILPNSYGFYLVPIQLFALFFFKLEVKAKVAVLILSLLVVLADLDARSNVIKFLIPLLISSLWLIEKGVAKRIIIAGRFVFIWLPMLLLTLALTDVFNVFKISDYVDGSYNTVKVDASGKSSVVDLTADTRTLLYSEVITSAMKNDYWLIGRTPSRGNETSIFSSLKDISGRAERYANEVAIANIFTWTGLIGVILYFIVFYRATYLAVFSSNSFFAKMIGLFVTIRWAYSWVEDINIFSLNYLFLWILIGLCYSKNFRIMTDFQFAKWIRSCY